MYSFERDNYFGRVVFVFENLGIGMTQQAENLGFKATTVSIGTNNSNYDDILAATSLVNMTSVNNMNNFLISALINSIGSNTDIKVNVSVGATATQCDIDVFVFGDYA